LDFIIIQEQGNLKICLDSRTVFHEADPTTPFPRSPIYFLPKSKFSRLRIGNYDSLLFPVPFSSKKYHVSLNSGRKAASQRMLDPSDPWVVGWPISLENPHTSVGLEAADENKKSESVRCTATFKKPKDTAYSSPYLLVLMTESNKKIAGSDKMRPFRSNISKTNMMAM
jgi:hypothetical protein